MKVAQIKFADKIVSKPPKKSSTVDCDTDTAIATPASGYTKKMPKPTWINVVDFFCGCGGMSWGFANTRQSHFAYRVLGGIDINKTALATYARNISAPAIREDIRTFAANPKKLSEALGVADLKDLRPLVFVGCPPCQGFSAHRKKDERDDPRNDLAVAFATLCAHFRPDAIVMENVPEMLKGRFGEYFLKASRIMEEAGYNLTKEVLDLSRYGVPQRRMRAVVIGSLGTPIPMPEPVLPREKPLTVRHAIGHLNPLKAGECDSGDAFHRAPSHIARIMELIKHIPADGGDRRSLPREIQLRCHSDVDKGATPGFTDVYGRLRWDSPAQGRLSRGSPLVVALSHRRRAVLARRRGFVPRRQRNVAELYEYWLFFQLLDWFCGRFNREGQPPLIGDLVDGLDGDTPNLRVKKRVPLGPFTGTFTDPRRRLHAAFSYNRQFEVTTDRGAGGSWTRKMHPDYTLTFWPAIDGMTPPEAAKLAEEQELLVHIHLDAKYRVENLDALFGGRDSDDVDEEEPKSPGNYKRQDLLKMHAYRDAIKRSEGAYVLYPGDENCRLAQFRSEKAGADRWPHTMWGFHEILPGLGAFAIAPDEEGEAHGLRELGIFLDEILANLCNRASLRESRAADLYEALRQRKSLYRAGDNGW